MGNQTAQVHISRLLSYVHEIKITCCGTRAHKKKWEFPFLLGSTAALTPHTGQRQTRPAVGRYRLAERSRIGAALSRNHADFQQGIAGNRRDFGQALECLPAARPAACFAEYAWRLLYCVGLKSMADNADASKIIATVVCVVCVRHH